MGVNLTLYSPLWVTEKLAVPEFPTVKYCTLAHRGLVELEVD